MSKPELIVDGKNRLGESAMWHPREQKLYWVDVRAPAIYRLEADNRVNDGSCDRMGRFWAGTQHVTIREPHGSLYRLDPDHSVRKMFEGITVTNMVRFSPDDRTLYYADTYSDRMYAFDYSLADGAIANRRVFVDTSSHPGHPDGPAIDADGCLWNAEYGRAWCATRRRAGSTAPSRFR